MKKYFMICAAVFLISFSVEARMQKETFNSGETLTAGKLFLNQVDAVSLYLSTQRIVYVPRLTEAMQLNVSLTLLGNAAATDRETLQKLVTRHINTFNKTLVDRLEYYTPQLAKEFKPMEDVTFVVQSGSEKETVATWKGGEWKWLAAGSAAPAATQTAPQAEPQVTPQEVVPQPEKKSCKKRCPALIGGDKTDQEEVAPQPQTEEAPQIEASPKPNASSEIPSQSNTTDTPRYGVGQ